MSDKHDEPTELRLTFDDGTEPLVIRDPENEDFDPDEGAHTGEARVEVDPLMDEYLKNPYDPVLGAMMGGRMTGEVIRNPPRSGWMRPIAYVIAFMLLGGGMAFVADSLQGTTPWFGGQGLFDWLRNPAIAASMALAGGILLWRLLYHR